MSTHIPQKALIFYCPSARPNTQFTSIDRITSKGGSGRIALEIEPVLESDQTVLQLLGLFETVDIKSEFKQRFNGMSLAIIADDPHTIQLAQQLGCHHEPISSQLQIDRLPFNVIFVDFTGVHSQDAWTTLDIVSGQNSGSNAIQCVISSSTTHTMLESHPPWWDVIRPRQSYLIKNGTPLASVQDRTLVYSYLHAGSSRQDSVSTFTESDIEAHGCNGTILAWHLLAEIGHKLGFVPKYGA